MRSRRHDLLDRPCRVDDRALRDPAAAASIQRWPDPVQATCVPSDRRLIPFQRLTGAFAHALIRDSPILERDPEPCLGTDPHDSSIEQLCPLIEP